MQAVDTYIANLDGWADVVEYSDDDYGVSEVDATNEAEGV